MAKPTLEELTAIRKEKKAEAFDIGQDARKLNENFQNSSGLLQQKGDAVLAEIAELDAAIDAFDSPKSKKVTSISKKSAKGSKAKKKG